MFNVLFVNIISVVFMIYIFWLLSCVWLWRKCQYFNVCCYITELTDYKCVFMWV